MDLIGQGKNRLDGRLKVTGHANFAADWPVDNVSHAVIFESTIANGTIRDFDFTDARKVEGVIDIITFQNAPRLKKPGGDAGGGMGEAFLPLQDNKIFYNGQFIGMVIATSLEAAQQAALLVKVRYNEKPAILDFDHLLAESYPKRLQMMQRMNTERGHVEKAVSQAPVVVRRTYTTPMENHNPMEPHATLAVWRDKDVLVYDATQGVFGSAKLLRGSFKLKNDELHVITKFVGGGFGSKGGLWPHQFLAVLASKKTGRPVKLAITRQQMFTGVGHRAPTVQNMTLAADQEGKLLAIEHISTNSTAINQEFAEPCGNITKMLYKCDNVKVGHRLVKINFIAPTFMRAPGESTGTFALESAMDELAHELKMDPLELRLKNYNEDDDGKPFTSNSLRQCYAEGAKAFGWSKRKAQPGTVRDGEWLIGHGMATASYPAMTFTANASVELLTDGTAKVLSATQDIGTGTYTVMTQVAAEQLGIPYEKVKFDLGDSRYPEAAVSGGSTSASSVGSAIKLACDDVKKQLGKMAVADKASPLHGLKADDLIFADGRIINKNSEGQIDTYIDLLVRNGGKSVEGKGDIGMQLMQKFKYSAHSFGAQFVEVRVHSLTGEVHVSRMVGAFAGGRILNEKTARSQYMGGMIFGVGMALMEQTIMDTRTGRLATKDLAEYHVPVNRDIPEMTVIMVPETDTIVNPIGTKGIGEIGITGVAAAIANAVYNATGIRVRDLPIVPEKVALNLSPA